MDRVARRVLEDAGYATAILHRTGHSLGESVHGNGVHLDDYETHDDRRILPGTGFTIEPGLYFKTFGVRTEINMVRRANDAVVRLLSSALGVTRANVTVLQGHTSRDKRVDVAGLERAELEARLERVIAAEGESR